jgi:hypothetical protein
MAWRGHGVALHARSQPGAARQARAIGKLERTPDDEGRSGKSRMKTTLIFSGGTVERKRPLATQATEIQRHLAVACSGFVAFFCSRSNG